VKPNFVWCYFRIVTTKLRGVKMCKNKIEELRGINKSIKTTINDGHKGKFTIMNRIILEVLRDRKTAILRGA